MTTAKVAEGVGRKKAEVTLDDDGNLVPGPLGLVSFPEIVKLLRVADVTPHQARARGSFPPEDDNVGGQPLWRVQTICRWAQQNGKPFYLTKPWVERLELDK